MSDLVEEHKRVAIDTCIWIYHFAEHPEFIDLTRDLLNAVQNGKCEAVVSELSLLEILVHPLNWIAPKSPMSMKHSSSTFPISNSFRSAEIF